MLKIENYCRVVVVSCSKKKNDFPFNNEYIFLLYCGGIYPPLWRSGIYKRIQVVDEFIIRFSIIVK